MPPETAITPMLPDARELLFLAPELLLTVWGLIVLIVDFGFLRRTPSRERCLRLGRLTLAGTILTLFAALFSLRPGALGVNIAETDLSLFFGTLSGDASTVWMNIVIVGLLALVVALSMTWNFTEHWGEYYALLLWAGVGMMLLIAAEELLTLFLTLETMTICLYLLTSLEKSRRRSAEGGLKYFVYGSVSSALFLFGLSLIYGLTGTTRISAIHASLLRNPTSIGLEGNIAGATAVLLILVGFGFKVAAVPFHQWAPDAYEGAPAPVSAWIASGSKVASFIAMMKVLIFGLGPWATNPDRITTPGWVGLLALIAAVSMTYGNFAALAQRNFKRMLAYSSVAHAGYLLVGVLAVAVSTSGNEAAGAVLYYLVTYGFATIGAFAVAAWLVHDQGSDEIDDLNGLGFRSPLLAVCIVLLMLSLIGMPPLAGFFGKLYMFMEAMNTGEEGKISLTWLVALGLFNSVVSAFYYVRVLKAMFLRAPKSPAALKVPSGVAWSILAATVVAVGFGLFPTPLIDTMKGASIPMLSAGTSSRFRTAAEPGAEARVIDFEKRQKQLIEDLKRRGIPSQGGPQQDQDLPRTPPLAPRGGPHR